MRFIEDGKKYTDIVFVNIKLLSRSALSFHVNFFDNLDDEAGINDLTGFMT